jgi:uncharacterized protein (DUF433 family)
VPTEAELLKRITFDPRIYGGKPIIRGRRMAVEHVLGMLAAGSSREEILADFEWMEIADIDACLLYACKLVANEHVEEVPSERPAAE